ncbi:MAG TPA: hypothetical protein VG184_00775 [Acidimicrobiales bacterium]|nr:hypothetical protein [Acidimicrobiales bacterium]
MCKRSEIIRSAISDGHLDDALPALVDAINDRRRRAQRDQTRRALQHLSVGTRVRLDEPVRPPYLQGCTGTIHQIDGSTVVVSLDTPVGRFTDGHISCSLHESDRRDGLCALLKGA